MLTLMLFARFENLRISWEGSTFRGKVGKPLESGATDMPQVCEGCTSETKVKLLDKRGAFLQSLPLDPRLANGRTGGATGEKRSSNGSLREKCTPRG